MITKNTVLKNALLQPVEIEPWRGIIDIYFSRNGRGNVTIVAFDNCDKMVDLEECFNEFDWQKLYEAIENIVESEKAALREP